MLFTSWIRWLKSHSRNRVKTDPRRRANRQKGSKSTKLYLEALEDRALPSTVNWINPAGGDWDTPANWSGGAVPGASDDVVIDIPGQNNFTVTHFAANADAVASLTSEDAVVISRGWLSLAAASAFHSSLAITGGTLSGAGNVTVDGPFDLGGTLTGDGSSVLTAYGSGSFGSYLSGRTVHLLGNTQLTGGTLANGAVLDNHGTLTVQSGGQVFLHHSDLSVQFINSGIVNINMTGSGEAVLRVPTVSSGSIHLLSGYADIGSYDASNDTFSGPVTSAAGTRLDLNSYGVMHFTPSSSIDGGNIHFYGGGTYHVEGSYHATNSTNVDFGAVSFTGAVSGLGDLKVGGLNLSASLDLTGATLTPAATTLPSLTLFGTLIAPQSLTVNGPFAWGGTLTGGGVLTSNGGMTGGGNLDSFTFNNAGYAALGGIFTANGAVLNNLATGTMDFQGDGHSIGAYLLNGAYPQYVGAVATFNNYGLLKKSVGSPNGESLIRGILFHSSGTVNVLQGTLEIGYDTGSDYSGPVFGAAGTTLEFDGATTTFNSSSINAANVIFGPGTTVTVADSYQATSTLVTASTVTFTGTVTGLGDLNVTTGSVADLRPAALTLGAAILPSLTLFGTLIAPQSLTVNGPFAWGGTLTGGGVLTSNGGMTGGGNLDSFTFNNAGYAALGGIFTANGAVLNNLATGTMDFQGDGHSIGAYLLNGAYPQYVGAVATFNNYGLLKKSVGSPNGESLIRGILFHSSGTVNVLQGTLEIGYDTGSDYSGPVFGAAGTTLEFDGATTTFNSSSINAANVIFGPGTTVTVADSYQATSTLVTASTVTFTGTVTGLGDLNVTTGSVADLRPAALTLGAAILPSLTLFGTLIAPQSLTVNGPFAWGGTLTGGGVLTSNGGMTGGGNLDSFTFNNAGYAALGGIFTANGAVLNNLATGTMDFQGDGHSIGAYLLNGAYPQYVGAVATFNNYGLLKKSVGSPNGESLIRGILFHSSGTVNVLQGTLEIGYDTGSDYSGPVFGAAGTTLEFDGATTTFNSSSINAANVIFGPGTTVTVADSYQATSTLVTASTVTFTGTVTGLGDLNVTTGSVADLRPAALTLGAAILPSLTLFGTLIAPQSLTVNGPFAWGGTLTGGGVLTSNGGMTGGGNLDSFTFNNAGYAALGGIFTANGAVLNNLATGTMDFQGDGHSIGAYLLNGAYPQYVGAVATFNNYGLLKKSVGSPNGESLIRGILFHSSGTVNVLQGTLEIGYDTGSDYSGPVFGAAGTTLEFDGATTTFNSSSINAANVIFGPGTTVTVADSYQATSTLVTASTVTFTGTVENFAALTVTNATLGLKLPSPATATSVVLASAQLQVSDSDLAPLLNQTYTLIDNQGPSAVSGTFNGLTEGSYLGGSRGVFRISYHGGNDGRDVTLTCVMVNPGDQVCNPGATVSLPISAIPAAGGSFSATGLPTGLTISAMNGTISGTLNSNTHGIFNVVVGSALGHVSFTWTVLANRPPTAVPDFFTTYEDQAISGNVLTNDSDPDPGDVLTVFAVNGSAAGVGQTVETAHGMVTLNANGTFTYSPGIGCEASSDSFTYTISDGNGGTATATVTIAISTNSGVSSSGGILRVGGTAGADVISIVNGKLRVNGTDYLLTGVTDVRIWGRDGNDQIDLSGLSIPSFIHGGKGNDTLTGGSGDDVILGGDGDDTVTGAAGNDLLVGGTGKDRIVGSAGNDILVAGDIECGLNLAALRAISNAWATSHSVASATVDDFIDEVLGDANADQLTGSAGADLFIIGSDDKITDFQFGKPNTNKDGDVVVLNGNVVP